MVSKASALRGMLSGVRASGWRRHGRVGYGGQVSLLKLVIGKGIRRRRSRLVQIGNGKGVSSVCRQLLFTLFLSAPESVQQSFLWYFRICRNRKALTSNNGREFPSRCLQDIW